jgi:hypothetical protein
VILGAGALCRYPACYDVSRVVEIRIFHNPMHDVR